MTLDYHVPLMSKMYFTRQSHFRILINGISFVGKCNIFVKHILNMQL